MKLRAFYFLLILTGFWAMPIHTASPLRAQILNFANSPWKVHKQTGYHFKAHKLVVADDACDQALDDASTRNLSATSAIGKRVPAVVHARWQTASDAQTQPMRVNHPQRYILFSSYLI